MEIVKKTGNFGNTLFEYKDRKSDREGLKVETPDNGTYFVYNKSKNTFHDASEFPDGIISKKKKMFGKENMDSYTIFFVNNGSLNCKNMTPKMAFDYKYYGVPVDLTIPYDIDYAYAPGRAAHFYNFVHSKNLLNGVDKDMIYSKISHIIDAVIQDVIGKEMVNLGVEDVENDNLRIANKIKETLNSTQTKLYDNGLQITDFVFSINDDDKQRLEEIRVRYNEALKRSINNGI